ncbi:hypothetical protein DH2020_012629 [Rehmannia glutinosa]|uniref:mitogen-activated protein kinase kinase kinase n=1 Tax=Rehmannia glutinosa TaxID=99300 RepID=A0ABR0X0I3_REHGL
MPAWWDKISGRSKDSETKSVNSASVKNKIKRVKENGNRKENIGKSFDEVLLQQQSRYSPRNSREFREVGGNSSGFSGFDSASSLDRGHPLPRPLESPNDQQGHVHGVGSGSGSGSVSSVSSSGSSDDHAPVTFDHAPIRGHGENRLSPSLRSPGRGSRCNTSATSPLHVRLGAINLDSPTGKVEDGKSECHRLPLPPGSPASPSALPTPRSPCANSLKWRKGRLLGRGTFGHVYLGFNSENGQMCAIKEVKVVSDDQSSKESLKQLNQEINLLSQLSHANIVQYCGSDLVQIASCSSMLSFKGSPYWMAPEVVMNTNGYSLPVDIWSLGCTVLEMATSRPPWSQYEGVAAIFKIGNSKDTPEIPDHLSADAKSFIRLCLQREPCARPTASQLLSHPFVRNQTTLRATNVNITREAFPRAFDGSRTPTALELQSSRTNNSYFDRDNSSRLTAPRTLLSPRDNARTITSLPVSPSSSPLRHDGGPAYRSCFLSPPHPYYAFAGQSSQNYGEHSIFPLRPNPRSRIDPWLEIPQFRAQQPVRSPTRTML